MIVVGTVCIEKFSKHFFLKTLDNILELPSEFLAHLSYRIENKFIYVTLQ